MSKGMGGIGLVIHKKEDVLELLRCEFGPQDKSFSRARMWGQLKVHKPKLSYRPIVDNSVKLGGPLEKYVLSILNEILVAKKVYTVRNSLEVIKIRTERFCTDMLAPAGHQVISADMYTNIPVEKALDLVEKLWEAQNVSKGGNENGNLSRVRDGLIPFTN